MTATQYLEQKDAEKALPEAIKVFLKKLQEDATDAIPVLEWEALHKCLTEKKATKQDVFVLLANLIHLHEINIFQEIVDAYSIQLGQLDFALPLYFKKLSRENQSMSGMFRYPVFEINQESQVKNLSKEETDNKRKGSSKLIKNRSNRRAPKSSTQPEGKAARTCNNTLVDFKSYFGLIDLAQFYKHEASFLVNLLLQGAPLLSDRRTKVSQGIKIDLSYLKPYEPTIEMYKAIQRSGEKFIMGKHDWHASILKTLSTYKGKIDQAEYFLLQYIKKMIDLLFIALESSQKDSAVENEKNTITSNTTWRMIPYLIDFCQSTIDLSPHKEEYHEKFREITNRIIGFPKEIKTEYPELNQYIQEKRSEWTRQHPFATGKYGVRFSTEEEKASQEVDHFEATQNDSIAPSFSLFSHSP